MRTKRVLLVSLALAFAVSLTSAQWNLHGLTGGVGLGGARGVTDSSAKDLRWMARAFLRYGIADHVQADLGAAVTEIQGDEYKTLLFPIDARLMLSPLSEDDWNPFLYLGLGALHYSLKDWPTSPSPGASTDGWTGVLPFGAGIQANFNENVLFEVSGGYNQSFTDDLDAVRDGGNDGYWHFLLGFTARTGESGLADADGDGLTNKEEAELGTDPHNPDTDGDGLTDGEEIHKYHTDPLKRDTDKDGLGDGDEVLKYHTDPLMIDTDKDGLTDGDEVLKYHTDPLKADTDGDGLSDGDEIMKYHTDPLKTDTDGGSVPDGTEVTRGTDPLNPADDVPAKKEELKTEVGKAIVLEGIVFNTGSAEINPGSEEILAKAFNTLDQNPDIVVAINGYTDNVGSRKSNMDLSLRRANAVKDYLVKKGIGATRVSTHGFGEEKPVASNKTADGRQKNRRIEFVRTK